MLSVQWESLQIDKTIGKRWKREGAEMFLVLIDSENVKMIKYERRQECMSKCETINKLS